YLFGHFETKGGKFSVQYGRPSSIRQPPFMKSQLGLFLVLLLLHTASFAQSASKDSVDVRSVAGSESKSTHDRTLLIDVRTPEEVAEGRLPGSININFLSEDCPQEIGVLNKNATALVYCRTGNKSRKAVDLLQNGAVKHVYILDGG